MELRAKLAGNTPEEARWRQICEGTRLARGGHRSWAGAGLEGT